MSPDGRHVATVLDGQLYVIPLTASGEAAGPPRALAAGLADQVPAELVALEGWNAAGLSRTAR